MDQNGINLADALAALRRRKRIVLILAGGFALFGVLYAVLETPLYTATATIIPSDDQDAGALSTLAASLGPAAAFAGINLGAGGANQEAYMAVLRSRELAGLFISRHDLLPQLFPGWWDVDAQQWKPVEPGIVGRIKQGISRTLAALSGDEGWEEPNKTPTEWQAFREFNAIRNVSKDSLTGIVTISFEFRDPELAAQWTNAYVALANQEIRKRTVEESSRALGYLNARAEETSIVGLRETIYRLVETQLERIMLANAREEFAFQVIDKAVPPEQRSHPSRLLVVILLAVLGLVLGVFAALGWESYSSGLGPPGP